MWGRGWLKTLYEERGLAENARMPSYMIFERFSYKTSNWSF